MQCYWIVDAVVADAAANAAEAALMDAAAVSVAEETESEAWAEYSEEDPRDACETLDRGSEYVWEGYIQALTDAYAISSDYLWLLDNPFPVVEAQISLDILQANADLAAGASQDVLNADLAAITDDEECISEISDGLDTIEAYQASANASANDALTWFVNLYNDFDAMGC